MPRWKPNPQARLERAALELFSTQGFAETTVAQIAAHAGLTTRSFFRHFPDKREVLFAAEEEGSTAGAEDTTAFMTPTNLMQSIERGLLASASKYEGRLEYLRTRQRVIESDEGLRERELRKRDDLSTAMIKDFKKLGVDDLKATLAAKIAVSIFSTAMTNWINQKSNKNLSEFVQESLDSYYSIDSNIRSDAEPS